MRITGNGDPRVRPCHGGSYLRGVGSYVPPMCSRVIAVRKRQREASLSRIPRPTSSCDPRNCAPQHLRTCASALLCTVAMQPCSRAACIINCLPVRRVCAGDANARGYRTEQCPVPTKACSGVQVGGPTWLKRGVYEESLQQATPSTAICMNTTADPSSYSGDARKGVER